MLTIAIHYLMEQIAPTFTNLTLTLWSVTHIRFRTWPNDVSTPSAILADLAMIFAPDLNILSATLEGATVKIFCSQTSSDYAYAGGDLLLELERADVTMVDETGTAYSLGALSQLVQAYWDTWAAPTRSGRS
jgi:hypothetical protein